MHGLGLLLLQIGVILLAARAVGWVARRLRQPQVVGEMVAGILLGPSLLGWVAPGLSGALFPPASLGPLHSLSQIGLLLFIFLVGLELDPRLLRSRGRAAVVISHASIVTPFLLGAALALHLYTRHSDASVSFPEFGLFMGAAMSVTAFPVLARILTERNLLGTKVGALTIACAAVDDVTAWCVLAGIVAFVRSDAAFGALTVTVVGSVVFAGVMLFAVRPASARLETYYHTRGRMTPEVVATIVFLLLASAWTTEWLGIHALFGAFLLGAVLPKDTGFVRDLAVRFEDVTVILFLPLFFAYTGLRTMIGLLDEPALWLEGGLVVAVAVLGKLGGSAVAARECGLSWREAGALGTLMNTRGLIELVILTIGLDLGVISPVVFVMMVLMALITTVMTTPMLERIYPLHLIRQETIGGDERSETPAVLIPVSLPSSGPGLLRVAHALVPSPSARIYGVHLLRPEERAMVEETGEPILPGDQAALRPLLAEAETLGVTVRPLAFVSRRFGDDIADLARTKDVELILLGWHKPVFSEGILRGAVAHVMERAPADVAVYVARIDPPWSRVLVPYRSGPHDRAALELARRLAEAGAQVTVLHVVPPSDGSDDPHAGARGILGDTEPEGLTLEIVESIDPHHTVIQACATYDLVLLGADNGRGAEPLPFGERHERIAQACRGSMLIIHRHGATDAKVS
jgi:Kef-type K+ transport system membrane component KefB/nucleotide-binding universal stress UspA family protein